jgi:drug/metabolite transporter (DMT)-like permease
MNNKLTNWTIFIVLCFIWGSSFKLMKDSTAALTAPQIAALRIFAAGLVFVPFAFFHFKKIPKPKLGLTKIDGSLGGILNSLTPIFVVVVGILFFKNKIETQKIIGVLTGFAGLVLLTLLPALTGEKTISFDNFSYTLLILLATFLYGINVNMVGKYLKGLSPIHAATVSLAFMVIPAFIILYWKGFFQLDFANAAVRTAVVYTSLLGILGSAIATALFYVLVKRAGGLFASLVTYGIPFIALLWGFFDGEKITWLEFVCLGIILVGVYLANMPAKKTVDISE